MVLELGPGADILRMIGGIFWLLVVGAFVAAVWIPKKAGGKVIAVAMVVALFVSFPGRWAWEAKQKANEQASRRAKAKAMFEEHCKSAGVKIYRTAENVEGIFLMKLRPEKYLGNEEPQFRLDDPYGMDSNGEIYVMRFLQKRNEKGYLVGLQGNNEKEYLMGEKRDLITAGYRYVELIHPITADRMRYEARLLTQKEGDARRSWETAPCGIPASFDEHYPKFRNCPVPITEPGPRYGITYDDISTHEDRTYWIAGSSLRIIDLQTGELMAERIGYMLDPLQGQGLHGSQPWLYAIQNACPPFQKINGRFTQGSQTRNFVEQVLKPKQVH